MRTDPRLLIITPDFPPARGGIQLLVHRLAEQFTRVAPLVVAPATTGCQQFDATSRIPTHRVRALRGFDHRVTMAALNAGAVAAARRFAPDLLLNVHIITSPAASLIRQHHGIPVAQYLLAKEAATRPSLAGFAARRSDATIAISRHTCELARHVGVDPARLHLITPGVDLRTRRKAARLDRPTVLTVARLEDRYKGHDTMLHALPLIRAKVPNVQWVVIGDGNLRPPLERLATIYGVADCVRFLGSVSDDERDRWLERSHVFTMPSRVPGDGLGGEGFGIVYLEASWHGLPIVAGDAGGALDAVRDGETGVLVDADDPVAVAEAIAALLRDPQRRAELGRHGEEWARLFDWRIIARRVEDVLLAQHALV